MERLMIYLAVFPHTVSFVFVWEEEGKPSPIYYLSKSITGPEVRYTLIGKLSLALIISARKLRPYFQAHPVVMVTSTSLKNILHYSDLSGRLTKWALDLEEFKISYIGRQAIKSQALTDFVANFSPGVELLEEVHHIVGNLDIWKVYVNGARNHEGVGLGLNIFSHAGDTAYKLARYGFSATNNAAEYEAMLLGLETAKELGAQKVIIHNDSQLIVSKIHGSY